ncbi:hypothetical protein HKD37_17G047868 [Glycine soja]
MNEDQKNWNEMTKIMVKINRKLEEIFNTIHIKDRSYGEVSSNDNMHSITYNQDLVNPTILAGWKEVKDFYGLSRNHQVTMTPFRQILLNDYKDVSSTMYSFMEGARFTHLNLKGIMECKFVYNHWRKSAKIDYGWRTFAQLQNLKVGTQILSSQMQHLTLFNFGFICNLSILYYTIICNFLFITLGGIFCEK